MTNDGTFSRGTSVQREADHDTATESEVAVRRHRTPATPGQVPAGMSHVSYCLSEAEAAFLLGNDKDGIASLAHAVYVLAVKREAMSERQAKTWFNRLERAADVWGADA